MSNIKYAIVTFGIVVAIALIWGGATLMITSNTHRDRDVRTACIKHGKQWISGNCIAVPTQP